MNNKQIRTTLRTFFINKAEEVGRETGFVKRRSKISAGMFLQILVFGFIERPSASLSELCGMASDLGVSVTKQGLQGRLKTEAVEFMKKMFDNALKELQQKVPMSLELLTQFAGVYLLDSTTISLPEVMKEEYRGCGGAGSTASLKLQTLWEMVCGQISGLWVTGGREADQGFTTHLCRLAKDSLFIADLGYFVLNSFQTIAQQGGYFISRFSKQTNVIDPSSGQKVDLLQFLRQTTHDRIDMQIELGSRMRLPTRLIAVRLPDQIVAERIRKANATAKRKGRTLSKAHLQWLAWSIYITNVPSTLLTLHQIVLLYTARWQIELLFKLWKSQGQINRIAGHKRERILCEIYAKLIGFVLFHFLSAPFRWALRELSLPKAFHLLQRFATRLAQNLNSFRLLPLLETLFQRWQSHALKDSRRKRLSTCRLIDLAAVHAAAPQFLLPAHCSTPPVSRPSTLSSDIFWDIILYIHSRSISSPVSILCNPSI